MFHIQAYAINMRNVEHFQNRPIAMAKFLCLFFLLTSVFSSFELVNTWTFTYNPDELVNQRIAHDDKKEILQIRQQSCIAILKDSPPECNVSLLASSTVDLIKINPSALTEDHLVTFNNALTQVCVAKCVNPILNYYRCLNISDEFRNYLITYVQRGICGKQGNDFCEVVYLRHYSNNIRFIKELVDGCPIVNSARIDCSSANSTCLQSVSNFNTNMGCCTLPYVGNVSSCNVTVIDPCESAISGSIIITPVITSLILAGLLAIFTFGEH